MPMLFSYGTLQQEDVQIATFGRILSGTADTLSGYRVLPLRIRDEKVIRLSGKDIHPVLVATGNFTDKVTGTVFELTDQELAEADEYEVDDYQRVQATMQSGQRVWIYCGRGEQ